MNKLALALSASLAVLAGCDRQDDNPIGQSQKPPIEDIIVGKWLATDPATQCLTLIHFENESLFSMWSLNLTASGSYNILEGGGLRFHILAVEGDQDCSGLMNLKLYSHYIGALTVESSKEIGLTFSVDNSDDVLFLRLVKGGENIVMPNRGY